MQVNECKPKRSVTASARRAQIVRAAIETIAELGYPKASFARIAERAQLSSTRLISYHFADKKELIQEVVHEIFTEIGDFMTERMQGQTSARGALHSYIRGNVEFIGTHRESMKALTSIFLSGGLEIDEADLGSQLSPIEAVLQGGQQSGEFRDFDTRVMASVLQRAIEGLPMLLAGDPELDLGAYADEVVRIFDLATSATSIGADPDA
jgi:AcrR family transcriptional regulator